MVELLEQKAVLSSLGGSWIEECIPKLIACSRADNWIDQSRSEMPIISARKQGDVLHGAEVEEAEAHRDLPHLGLYSSNPPISTDSQTQAKLEQHITKRSTCETCIF